MMAIYVLVTLLVVLPLLGVGCEWVGSGDILERHHKHHGTYIVPHSYTRFLVVWMAVVSLAGLAAAWLMSEHVIPGDVTGALTVFLALELALSLEWGLMRRYKVITYDDRLRLTPHVGPSTDIPYASITRMSWTKVGVSGFPNLQVEYGDGHIRMLSGMLDLNQIISVTGRDDAIDDGAGRS